MRLRKEAVQWAKATLQNKDAATAHEIIAAEELLRLDASQSAPSQSARSWIGCGDCDEDFPCYEGRTHCFRLLGDTPSAIGEPEKPRSYVGEYMELLYAVARAWPNETRHQTALRYIQEAERRDNSQIASTDSGGA